MLESSVPTTTSEGGETPEIKAASTSKAPEGSTTPGESSLVEKGEELERTEGIPETAESSK